MDFYCYKSFHDNELIVFDIGYYKIMCKCSFIFTHHNLKLLFTDYIRNKMYLIRGQQVMLEKCNSIRFPENFMFQLEASEITDSLKSQFATLNVSENKRGMGSCLHGQIICMERRILFLDRIFF